MSSGARTEPVTPGTVCVIGSGGREHALALALGRTAEVVVTPGNPGIDGKTREGHRISSTDLAPERIDADLFVVGPEAPLVDGVADRLRAAGRLVFGPGADGARLEGSKAFMKEVLAEAQVPTARFAVCSEVADARAFLRSLPGPWVVKTDGLAAGKGVLVTASLEEATADVEAKLSGRAFGEAGRTVVVEEGLAGEECSLLVLCDGRRLTPLAPAQDFKRIGDGDTGPNTGGMGSYSPVPFVDEETVERMVDEAVAPLVDALRARGIEYRGVLYAGVMLTPEGPKVLEFNVRFGDPETQVVLPRLEGDVTALLAEVAAGELTSTPRFSADAAVCVVLASEGYPDAPRKGDVIGGLDEAAALEGVTVFHAGTARPAGEGEVVTAGGRVLGVTGVGPSIATARARAYRGVIGDPLAGDADAFRHRGSGERSAPRAGEPGGRTVIPRYAPAEMAELFTDRARFATWLEVELLATEGWAEIGTVPAEAAAACRARAPKVDDAFVEAVAERERVTDHDVAAFVDVVQAAIGAPEGSWIHYGLTSSDVVDTALCATLTEAADQLIGAAAQLVGALEARAFECIDTPVTGRTHGMHAEPTTFGAKFSLWALQAGRDLERLRRARERVAVGKLSGAVGTYSNIDPRVESHVCRALGLTPVPATQVVARDRHAEYLYACAAVGTTVESIATEVRHLARSELGEVEEPFAPGQKGSSAMPHKRNPILSERLSGLARVLRGYLSAGLEDVALWHERDISHSSVERVVLPDASMLTLYMLQKVTGLVEGLVVHPERALATLLEGSHGLVFSQSVLLALVRGGIDRDAAYRIVQRDARAAWEEGRSFREVLDSDPEVTLPPAALDEAFDLSRTLRHVHRFTDALEELDP